MTPTRWTLTAHAATVLLERDIDPEWISRALQSPLRVDPDPADPTLQHALAAIAEREGRVLRVVHRQSADTSLVVTAFFDRVETRKLRQ